MEKIEQSDHPTPPQPPMPKPDNNMVLAVLTTVLLCMPFGLVGIVYASKVDELYYAGDYAGALAASKNAHQWSLVGIVVSIGFGVLFVLFYFFFVGAAVFASIFASMGGMFD